MRRLAMCCIAVLLVTTAGCRKEEERRGAREQIRETGSDARQTWDRAWSRVAEVGDRTAEAGEYAIERTKEGAIRVYRKTELVAGETAAKLEDAAVATEVKTKLAVDPHTKARTIDVDAKDGVVTLSGKVSSALEASEAVRIATGTKGVTEVVSNLTWN